MKRFYFSLFIACLLLSYKAYGQHGKLAVSTHINFNKNAPWAAGTLTENASNIKDITLTPRATFRLNRVWALGAVYQYNRTDQEGELTLSIENDGLGSPLFISSEAKTIYQHAGVLVQAYVYDSGKIAAFLEMDGTKGVAKTEISFSDGYTNQSLSAKYDAYSTGLHAGGRYNFFKGLGAEVRLNGLVQYNYLKAKENGQKSKQFYLFDNFWNNCSVGISYQF